MIKHQFVCQKGFITFIASIDNWVVYLNVAVQKMWKQKGFFTFIAFVLVSKGGNPRGRMCGRPRGTMGGDPRGTMGGSPRGTMGGNPRGTMGGNPRGAMGGYPRGAMGGNHGNFHDNIFFHSLT